MKGPRAIAELNWLVFTSWTVLHAPFFVHAADVDLRLKVTTECGRRGEMNIPGVLARDPDGGLPRCGPCCDATGMPRGFGSPKNGNAKCHLCVMGGVCGRDPKMTPKTPYMNDLYLMPLYGGRI